MDNELWVLIAHSPVTLLIGEETDQHTGLKETLMYNYCVQV